jgi:malonate transporter
LAGRLRRIDNVHVESLNAFVMDYALPAAILAIAVSAPKGEIIQQWRVPLGLAATMLGLYATAYVTLRRLLKRAADSRVHRGLDDRSAQFWGRRPAARRRRAWAPRRGFRRAGHSVDVRGLSADAHRPGAGGGPGGGGVARRAAVVRAVGRSLSKPIVILPLVGIAVPIAGVSLPSCVLGAFTLMGQSAAGVALFLTGLLLSAQRPSVNATVLTAVALKNIVQPLVAVVILALLGADRMAQHAGLILTSVPSGFFGLRYGADPREAAAVLVLSSVLGAPLLAIASAVT